MENDGASGADQGASTLQSTGLMSMPSCAFEHLGDEGHPSGQGNPHSGSELAEPSKKAADFKAAARLTKFKSDKNRFALKEDLLRNSGLPGSQALASALPLGLSSQQLHSSFADLLLASSDTARVGGGKLGLQWAAAACVLEALHGHQPFTVSDVRLLLMEAKARLTASPLSSAPDRSEDRFLHALMMLNLQRPRTPGGKALTIERLDHLRRDIRPSASAGPAP